MKGFRSGETTRLGFVELWLLAREGVLLASPLLLAWSAAVLVSRLRGPRPRRRRLWCQPGFLACLAVLLVHGLRLLGFGAVVIAELVAAGKQSGPVDAAALATDLLLLLSHNVLVKADAGGAVPGVARRRCGRPMAPRADLG